VSKEFGSSPANRQTGIRRITSSETALGRLTPIDDWEELPKGNLGIVIIMAAVIIGFAIVVGSMVAPPPVVPVEP
jgi:hypothetical protein